MTDESDEMIQEVMKRRRSIRKFKKEKFAIETLCSIVNTGLFAPSGADQSPYTIVIIDDEQLKRKIRKECEAADKDFHKDAPEWLKEWFAKKNITTEKAFLTDAPYLIVIAGNTTMPYWLESTWLAIAYMLLAAEEEDLGTLTYTPGRMDFLVRFLDLPKKYSPVVIIPIGYPGEHPIKSDNNKENKIFFNRFGFTNSF